MDISKRLKEQVDHAVAEQHALSICGGNTQNLLVAHRTGEELSTKEHRGVIDYQASELTLQVRAGTPLAEVNELLSEKGQMLAFESAEAGGDATIGGAVATALAGPRSGFAGGVSDFILGATLLNGKGDILHFGGQVMKNVAGFDVSRYLCGTYGCSGILLDISFKVLPKPYSEQSYQIPLTVDEVSHFLEVMRGHPLSGNYWNNDRLYLRVANGNSRFEATLRENWGAVPIEGSAELWSGIREKGLNDIDKAVASSVAAPNVEDCLLLCSLPGYQRLSKSLLRHQPVMECNGTRYWFRTSQVDSDQVQSEVLELGGFVLNIPNQRSDQLPSTSVASQVPLLKHGNSQLKELQRRIRYAFDPHCLFNRGQQLMPWLESPSVV